MRIVNGNPELLSVSWMVAALPPRIPPRICGLSAAFFAKATFKLAPGEAAAPWPEGPKPPLGDVPFEDASQGLAHASDFVPYKPQGEYLLTGTAHAPGGVPASRFAVGVKIGNLSRELVAIGPRQWKEGLLGATPGRPEPVASVGLHYANAWGGEGYELNPLGRGCETMDMAMVEIPGLPVESRRSRVSPACFAPVPRDWKQRASKVGSYGGSWTEERWPWLPDDFDYSYFNAAPPAQWHPEFWRGDEEMIFENLHLEHATYATRLPGLRARCFVTRVPERGVEGEPGPLHELEMVLDTIAVDMDAEMMEVVWRGRFPTQTIKLPDIDNLLIFADLLGEARPEEACREMLLVGLNPPPDLELKAPDAATLTQSIEVEILKARTRMFEASAQAYQGFAAAIREAAKTPKEMTTDVRRTIETGVAQFDRTRAVAPAFPAALDPLAVVPAELRKKAELPPLSVPEPEALAKEMSAQLAQKEAERQGLLDRFAGGRTKADYFRSGCLDHLKLLREGAAGVDMRGVDFSGLDLAAVTFQGAVLAGASFRGCHLFGADFSGADLSDADLSDADLTQAVFHDADLAGCRANGAVWRKSFLKGASLAGLALDGLDFSGALAPLVDFSGASLRGALFTGAKLPCADFSKACVEEADFSGADLSFGDFRGAVARGARFAGAQLPNLRAGEGAIFESAIFREATAPESIWEGARLDWTDFCQANLSRARFCEASLGHANFDRSDLTDAVFEDAKLQSAELTNANLLRVVFDRADLSDAVLDDSNLYEAGFWEANLRRASWCRAFIKRTILDF